MRRSLSLTPIPTVVRAAVPAVGAARAEPPRSSWLGLGARLAVEGSSPRVVPGGFALIEVAR